MNFFFDKISFDEDNLPEFGFFFFSRKKLIFLNGKKNRMMVMFFHNINSFFLSRFFTQNRLTIKTRNKNLLSLVGFNYQNSLNLEFLIKKYYSRKIMIVPSLNFLIQNLKIPKSKKEKKIKRTGKYDFFTTWEIGLFLKNKDNQKTNFLTCISTSFEFFRGYFLKPNLIFLHQNPLQIVLGGSLNSFPYILPNKKKKFLKSSDSFRLTLKKKRLLLENFQKSLVHLNCCFVNFRKIFFKPIFSNNRQFLTFSLLPLIFSQKNCLKKIELSFFSKKNEISQNNVYFFKKNKRIFRRKIFTKKFWLILTTLIHQKKGLPLKIKEIFKIS